MKTNFALEAGKILRADLAPDEFEAAMKRLWRYVPEDQKFSVLKAIDHDITRRLRQVNR